MLMSGSKSHSNKQNHPQNLWINFNVPPLTPYFHFKKIAAQILSNRNVTKPCYKNSNKLFYNNFYVFRNRVSSRAKQAFRNRISQFHHAIPHKKSPNTAE